MLVCDADSNSCCSCVFWIWSEGIEEESRNGFGLESIFVLLFPLTSINNLIAGCSGCGWKGLGGWHGSEPKLLGSWGVMGAAGLAGCWGVDCWCTVCDFEVAKSSQLACTWLPLSGSATNLQPIFVVVTVLVATLQGDLADPKDAASSSSFSATDLMWASDCARDRLCASGLWLSVPYERISIYAWVIVTVLDWVKRLSVVTGHELSEVLVWTFVFEVCEGLDCWFFNILCGLTSVCGREQWSGMEGLEYKAVQSDMVEDVSVVRERVCVGWSLVQSVVDVGLGCMLEWICDVLWGVVLGFAFKQLEGLKCVFCTVSNPFETWASLLGCEVLKRLACCPKLCSLVIVGEWTYAEDFGWMLAWFDRATCEVCVRILLCVCDFFFGVESVSFKVLDWESVLRLEYCCENGMSMEGLASWSMSVCDSDAGLWEQRSECVCMPVSRTGLPATVCIYTDDLWLTGVSLCICGRPRPVYLQLDWCLESFNASPSCVDDNSWLLFGLGGGHVTAGPLFICITPYFSVSVSGGESETPVSFPETRGAAGLDVRLSEPAEQGEVASLVVVKRTAATGFCLPPHLLQILKGNLWGGEHGGTFLFPECTVVLSHGVDDSPSLISLLIPPITSESTTLPLVKRDSFFPLTRPLARCVLVWIVWVSQCVSALLPLHASSSSSSLSTPWNVTPFFTLFSRLRCLKKALLFCPFLPSTSTRMCPLGGMVILFSDWMTGRFSWQLRMAGDVCTPTLHWWAQVSPASPLAVLQSRTPTKAGTSDTGTGVARSAARLPIATATSSAGFQSRNHAIWLWWYIWGKRTKLQWEAPSDYVTLKGR